MIRRLSAAPGAVGAVVCDEGGERRQAVAWLAGRSLRHRRPSAVSGGVGRTSLSGPVVVNGRSAVAVFG